MSGTDKPHIVPELPETLDLNGEALELGSRVRSFSHDGRDVEGERASFVEGVLEGVCRDFPDCLRYAIKVDRHVSGGKESDRLVGEHVFPPLNGTPSWLGGETSGVEKIGT